VRFGTDLKAYPLRIASSTMRNFVKAVFFFGAWITGWALGLPEELEPSCSYGSSTCQDSEDQRGLFQKRSQKAQGQMELDDRRAADDHSESLLAPLSKMEWAKALGPEIDYRHMKQGTLGDCYFLAAMVAIAYKHSDILRDMFTNGELLKGENPVYTTKWLINGQQHLVATTDKLPINPNNGKPAFAKGKEGAFWPSVLEKAWAKIFGQYMKLDGGHEIEVFKAITQAPIEKFKHDRLPGSKEDYWQKLLDWTQKGYVMGAGTDYSRLGLSKGHAYAVLEATQHSGSHPQRVKIYNPWGADYYNGKLKNLNLHENDGIFTMTYDEFLYAFGSSAVAHVRKGAVISSMQLSRESQSSVVLEFDMKSNEPFDVQLEWPSVRFIDLKCQVADPDIVVAVAKEDSLTGFKIMEKSTFGATNARASFPGGAGKYLVTVNLRFPYTKSWLKEFVINVYGPQTKLALSSRYSSSIDLFLEMQGLCKTVTVPELYNAKYDLDEKTKVFGLPVFRFSADNPAHYVRIGQAFSLLFWDAKRQKTTRVNAISTSYDGWGSNTWQLAPNTQFAESPRRYRLTPHPRCSASLLQEDILQGGNTAFNTLVLDETDVLNVGETDLEDKVEVEGSCAKLLDRLPAIGKASSIASSGKDAEFPESLESIAPPKADCGDAANGRYMDCAVFNNWKSVSELMGKSSGGGGGKVPTPEPTAPPTPPPTQPASSETTIKVGPSSESYKCVPAQGVSETAECQVLNPAPGSSWMAWMAQGHLCVYGDYAGWNTDVEVACAESS